MKKQMIIASCLLFVAFATSCSKIDNAEEFVGTYNVSTVEHVTWGNDSGSLTDTGVLTITKVSKNRVRTSVYFTTEG